MELQLRADGLRVAMLSPAPMLGAVAGGIVDERLHLGFTTWRTACRSAGLRIPTLVDFTLQLLPWAVIGLLIGGLLVLAAGLLRGPDLAKSCAAAHAGCVVTLPAMLILCAFLPPPWVFAADVVLAMLAALLMLALMRTPSRARCAHP